MKRPGNIRRIGVALAVLLACLLRNPSASAQSDAQIYKKIAPSTVWFFEQGSATGVLVDVNKRWILTAEHVVRSTLRSGRTNVKVIFAQLDGQGNVLTEVPNYGFEKKRILAIPGKIIRSNRMKDMALIELERLPDGVKAVALASVMPQPGDDVNVIGNSTYSNGGLFSYSNGRVRNSYFFERLLSGDCFFALAHHAPTNRGDSGGPVLNNKGELIGIISQGTTGSGEGVQVIDHSVHIQEIRQFLSGANLPVVKKMSFTGTINVRLSGDFFYIPVAINNQIDLNLQGNGATDLDLYAFDFDSRDKSGKAMMLAKQDGLTDKEKDSFPPKYSGVCHVEVRNLTDPKNQDLALTAKNAYSLDVENKNAVRGPITAKRYLVAQGIDTYKIQFNQGPDKVHIEICGDGDTVLELVVTDPKGKELARRKGETDRIRAEFVAQEAGVYSIKVANMSPQQFNRYTLIVD